MSNSSPDYSLQDYGSSSTVRTNAGQGGQSVRGAGRVMIRGTAATGQGSQSVMAFGVGKHTTEPRAALQKLLKYPHRAVFDKAPDAVPVVLFDEAYEGKLSWRINETVLEVTLYGFTRYYDMLNATVFDLVARIRASGIGARIMDSAFSPLSAMVLVDESTTPRTDMDPILGFRSLLWALLYAYAHQTALGRYQVTQALRQMIVGQSDGFWLDLWGALYDVPRLPGETDQHMQPRIGQEAFRVRVNALAIEQAVKDHTGKDVIIEEPWGLMFRLDESALSGSHRFYNGENVGYHLLRPVSRESIDWTDVLAVIERNRAAGVIVLDPEVRMGRWVDASIDGTIWSARTSQRAIFVPFFSDNRLDYLVLSGEEITRNWPVMMSQLMTHTNSDPLLDPVSISQRRTIAKASVVLSDGFRLGDENAVLPRAELTQEGGAMHVSDDLELSSPNQKPVWKPVDFISTELHSRGELDTGGPVAVSVYSTQLVTHRAFVDASLDGTASIAISAGFTWVTAGAWGDFPWSASQYEMLRIENIINRMHQYANFDLNEDLQQ